MSPTTRTKLLLGTVLGLLLAYEAYALANDEPGDTISAAVWSWSDAHPDFKVVATLIVLALLWHFFAGWRRGRIPE